MDIFRTIFEQNLTASINSDGNIEFGFADTELTPVEVLGSDKEAYEEEYRAWLNDVWLDRHRSRLKHLLKLRNNEKRFNDLCSAVRGGSLVPMVGSGMSCASGFPLWSEFLKKIRVYSSVDEDELEAMLNTGQYEEAIDRMAADMGNPLFDEQVEHILRVEAGAKIDGPVRLLPELFQSLVLTTNLDDVIEHVYEESGKRIQYSLAGKDIERYRKLHTGGSSCLLKLHGDCHNDNGRVLGVKEYEEAYGAGGGPREALSLIYRTRPLLWLGCSLSIDRTVTLAGELAYADSKMPRHFAVLQQPSNNDIWLLREKELTARQIFPIWYDGDHDECIETLLVGILDSQNRFEDVRYSHVSRF
jgi:hypothetical protein